MDRPSFSLETQAQIEQARYEIFNSAESLYDMLFFPLLMEGFSGILNLKNIPVQKRPARLKLQLAKYATALYDAEAAHYPSGAELARWLGNLAERINKEVRNVAEDERNNIHCGLQERLDAVTDALAARAQWWLDAKQKAKSKPITSRAPRPIVPVIPFPALPTEPSRPESRQIHIQPIEVQPVEELPKIEPAMVAEKPPSREELRLSYLAQFPNENIKVLDICWAAGQHYSEWKRWLRGVLVVKDGSTPDRAFRGILTSGKRPPEYKKALRKPGWK